MPSLPPPPEPYYEDSQVTLYHGDALATLRSLPDASVNCCVTSPPYFGLRDYGEDGQYGLEASPAEYVETMRAVFAEVRRVLADDGTLWLNIGDSYSSDPPGASPYADRKTTLNSKRHSPATKAMRESVRRAAMDRTKFLPRKNLMGMPWRTAFALQADGWVLRNDNIWHKTNAMPESAKDRMSNKHEHLFMFSKSERYWFDAGDGPNPGDVWSLPTQPFSAAHFAVYPSLLAERAILAGCKPQACVSCGEVRRVRAEHEWHCSEPTCMCADDELHIDTAWMPSAPSGVVLDPFSGSGTTGLAATKHGRKYVGIDLSATYLDLSLRTRFAQPGFDLSGGVA